MPLGRYGSGKPSTATLLRTDPGEPKPQTILQELEALMSSSHRPNYTVQASRVCRLGSGAMRACK